MLGLKINLENDYNNYLSPIIEATKDIKGAWKSEFCEIYKFENGKTESFPIPVYLSNDEFYNLLKSPPYYIIFLNIQLFVNDLANQNVHNYKSFIESDCLLIVTIVDSTYLNVISKDNALIKKIESNMKKQFNLESEIVAGENIHRLMFTV